MKVTNYCLLAAIFILSILGQHTELSAQAEPRFDISINPACEIFIDLNQTMKVEFSAVYRGSTPDRMTVKISNPPSFFRWDQLWRNDRSGTNRIYNDFYLTTKLDSLKDWNLNSGMYNLVLQISAYIGGEVFITEKTIRVIIRPAILSTHQVARGSQNVIEWIDSDSLRFSIIDPHQPGVTQTTTSATTRFTKAMVPPIKRTSFDGLIPGQSYEYWIDSRTHDNQSVHSNSITIMQDGTPPAPVQNLTSHSAPAGHILLSWNYDLNAASNADLRGFYIYREKETEELQLIDSILVKEDPTQFTFLDGIEKGLESGQYYSYRVSAYDTVFNVSPGDITLPELVDSTPPAKPYFIWQPDSGYFWRNEYPPKNIKDQGYKYAYYKKGKTNQIYLLNPNPSGTSELMQSTHVLLQWVREYSHFFDLLATAPVSDKNYFSTDWLPIDELFDQSSRCLTYQFDFSNNGNVTDEEIQGHFYKYRVKLKDYAGNESEWSREHLLFPDDNFVGTFQDLFPPEPVFVLKSIVESADDNNVGFVNLQWQAVPDLVSGLSHFILYRAFADDSVTAIATIQYVIGQDTYVYHDALKNFVPDYFVEHDFAEYWIIPVDHVGNQSPLSKDNQVTVCTKNRPQLTAPRGIFYYGDTLKCVISFYSSKTVSEIQIFVDGAQLTTMPIEPPKTADTLLLKFPVRDYPLLDVPQGSTVSLSATSQYADGDHSLNSKQAIFTRDIISPTTPNWSVKNSSDTPCDSIDSSFENFPTINIFSLDKDVDSLYIVCVNNITNNSQFGSPSPGTAQDSVTASDSVIFALGAPFDLPIGKIDSSAAQLFDYGYYLVIVDSAGNKVSSDTLRGYGVQTPFFQVDTVSQDLSSKRMAIHFSFKFPEELYKKGIRYEIRVLDEPIDEDPVIIKPPDYRGPNPSGFQPPLENGNVIISDTFFQNSKDRGKYYLYATLFLKDDCRHTRAGVDSLEGFLTPHLQKPQFDLVDQPGIGKIFVSWHYLEYDKNIPPNVFKVKRIIQPATDTMEQVVTSPFMDNFVSSENLNIQYQITPGYAFTKDDTSWDTTNTASMEIVDTRRAFIPFPVFPGNDSTHYLPVSQSNDFTQVYFRDDSLRVHWAWHPDQDALQNNQSQYVGEIQIQVAFDLTFTNPCNMVIPWSSNTKSFIAIPFTKIDSATGHYLNSEDQVFVRLAARDTWLHEANDIWSETIWAIYDNVPPYYPEDFNCSLTYAISAETDVVDILATWQPVTDRLSGYQKCHLTITGLFDIMIDFDLLPNTYIYPQPQKPSVWWRPAKNKEEKDSLNICNVKLTKLLLASDSPLIHFDYLDSLLNVNTRQVGTVDLPDPLPHEYQLTITDSLEKSFLRWQPIPPQLTQWFDHYVINFSDRIDYLGRPLTNFRFLRQPVWEIPIDSLKKDITYYFHVMAEFADGSCTNWSNVVEFTKSTSASHLIPIYADAQDGKPVQPENYQLYQNYPNPFNPVTTIEYDLPQTDWVILRIYDVFGRTIRTLIDEEQPFGRYRLIWDGRNENGIQTASGVYFITMNTSRFQTTKKCALMK